MSYMPCLWRSRSLSFELRGSHVVSWWAAATSSTAWASSTARSWRSPGVRNQTPYQKHSEQSEERCFRFIGTR